MQDLIPQNPLIGYKPAKRNKKNKKFVKTEEKNEDLNNPFKNVKSFVIFYRNYIKSLNSNVDFINYSVDVKYATSIIDHLIDLGKYDDINFLRRWIKYYLNIKLSQDDFTNKNKISLRSFLNTLKEYNAIHVD